MLDPTPETLEAIKELTKIGDIDVAMTLLRMSDDVQRVVPQCVGLSLNLLDEELTFTAVASEELAADLDAIQYLDGGPCVEAADTGETVAYHSSDVLDEERWAMFAKAGAAAGVASTLSLPIVRNGRVNASVNLYGSTPDAFDGRHEQVASVCGAWAPGAVTNADLAFRSRLEAAKTPQRVRDRRAIHQAVGLLTQAQHISAADAAERLSRAATRAGISEGQAARVVIRTLV
jgi:GAF domain-containing protein